LSKITHLYGCIEKGSSKSNCCQYVIERFSADAPVGKNYCISNRESLFKYENAPLYYMKWITREHAKAHNRIGCSWLIKSFIAKGADVLSFPARKVKQVAKEQIAIPFDVPSAQLRHYGDEGLFDVIIKRDNLDETKPSLYGLSRLVGCADTANRVLTRQSQGFVAMATGFSLISKDDYDDIAKQRCLYDALPDSSKSDEIAASSRD
jgi:hypothetical protein